MLIEYGRAVTRQVFREPARMVGVELWSSCAPFMHPQEGAASLHVAINQIVEFGVAVASLGRFARRRSLERGPDPPKTRAARQASLRRSVS